MLDYCTLGSACSSLVCHALSVRSVNENLYYLMQNQSYYNKCNAHFNVYELLLQFWTERHETWQEYGEA